MMRWFKKKKIETDPLKRALDRKGVITRLEGMGYFVRKKNIRKPKVGDTVRFRVGGRWSINTHYFQTGEVVEWSNDDTHKPWEKYGYIRAVGKKSDHCVHPLEVVSVSRPKSGRSDK